MKRVWFRKISQSIHLKGKEFTGLRDEPIGLTFLGTCSQTPTSTRGTSCIAMRKGSDVWLFDCGEGTQKQIQTSSIKPSRIKKIFLTHLHGDHVFGLPAVLCLIGSSHDRTYQSTIDIYGPEGIRTLIRTVSHITRSHIMSNHRIHELKFVEGKVPLGYESLVEPVTNHRGEYGEKPGSTNIYPDSYGRYHLVDNSTENSIGLIVSAAPLSHTIPCVGYVIQDSISRERKVKTHLLTDIIERNAEDLKSIYKSKERVYHDIKKLPQGGTFTFPDGTVILADEVLHDKAPGRKIVILGDNSNASKITQIAQNADLLVHEATNTFFPENEEENSEKNYLKFEREVKSRGHSTPQMAGKFASSIGAKKLILTHFSGRYTSEDTPETKEIMTQIEKMAQEAGNLTTPVTAAYDFLDIDLPVNKVVESDDENDLVSPINR